MSSQSNLTLEEAINQMAQEVELEFIDMAKTQVIKESQEIAQEIQVKYDAFFEYMVTRLIGRNDAPGWFAKYLPQGEWTDITAKWSNTKHRINQSLDESNYNSYYKGISNRSTAGKGLTVQKNGQGAKRVGITRRKSGKVKVPPFASYISSLQGAGTTEKFFGPVTLQYEIQSPNVGVQVTAKMGHKTLTGSAANNSIKNIYAKNVNAKGKPFTALSKDLMVTARVEAFGSLRAIEQTEWAIVDYIIKRINTTNEKQWVKINGRRGGHGRGNRPIRALILPMVQWYFNQLLPDAISGL